jgi:spore coat protein U-like protein
MCGASELARQRRLAGSKRLAGAAAFMATMRMLLLVAFMCIVASAAAHATATCTLSGSGVQFGVFSGSQLAFTGTVTIKCTGSGSSNYTLALNAGSSGSFSSRQMKNGANTLTYNLYTDSAHTHIWGDGTGGSTVSSGSIVLSPPPSVTITTNVFGLLPAQATPAQGSYSDTITATLTCTSGGACTTTTTFTVTATVQPVCTISAANLPFGTYAGPQLDAQSQITVTCANTTPWNVGLNQGTFAGATVTTRRMSGPGGAALTYALYQNAARTTNWGNTVGTDTVSGTGTGAAQLLNVYGRIPGAQAPVPGSYTDTILVTLTY